MSFAKRAGLTGLLVSPPPSCANTNKGVCLLVSPPSSSANTNNGPRPCWCCALACVWITNKHDCNVCGQMVLAVIPCHRDLKLLTGVFKRGVTFYRNNDELIADFH